MYVDQKYLSTSLCESYEPCLELYGGIPTLSTTTIYPGSSKLNESIVEINNPFLYHDSEKKEQFLDYWNTLFNTHEYLYISAEFKTKFFNKQYNGNYGLKIYFWEKNNTNNEIMILFDLQSFNGDPYDYFYFSQQGAVIDIK